MDRNKFDLVLTYYFEFHFSKVFGLASEKLVHVFTVIHDVVHNFPIYLKQNVSKFQSSVPCWAFSVNQNYFHARLVVHRTHAAAKIGCSAFAVSHGRYESQSKFGLEVGLFLHDCLDRFQQA